MRFWKRWKALRLLRNRSGIRLDLACGANKQPGFVGMDIRREEGVDIVHDMEDIPWPLPDGCCSLIMASHIMEHVNPARFGFVRVMDECWRVLQPEGQLAIVMPHGRSSGYLQDPTHCLLPGAEVLTESGFKDFRQVAEGEQILTLNLQTETTEWSPCRAVIREDYKGEILRFFNSATHIAVTPNHDLVWRTWQPVKGYHKSAAFTFEQVGAFARRGLRTIPDWDGVETVSGDFMELLGWILSEGSFVKKGNYKRILIHQSSKAKPENYVRIRNLLAHLGLETREYERHLSFKDDQMFGDLSILGESHERFIPQEYKNQSVRLLSRLLESLLLGDGERHSHGGGYTLTTTSAQLAADVHEIALKCGMESSIRERQAKTFLSPNGKQYTRRKQYRVSITDNRPMLYPEPSREEYEGEIVCVQVADNHTLFTRYEGRAAWVGNCNQRSEATWAYFDPDLAGGGLYGIYHPKPWKVESLTWSPEGNMEVLLRKRGPSNG